MPLFDIAIILVASFSLAELRAQMPAIVVGFILLLAGVAAAVLFFFRRRSQDLTLIYLSLFSILYATRLLIRVPLVRSLAGISEVLRWHLDIAITFAILIPFLLFLGEVRGSHLKPVKPLIRILVFAQALFAAVVDGLRKMSLGTILPQSIKGLETPNLARIASLQPVT